MNKTIKMIQINKGTSELNQKIVQINDIIHRFKPQILVINELNLTSNDTMTRNMFTGYNLETDNLDIIDKMSRTGVLIQKNLHYKRRHDLEINGISTVWLQLQHPGRKPLLVQSAYRQFQRLGRPGTLTPASQRSRWSKLIAKWEAANLEGK